MLTTLAAVGSPTAGAIDPEPSDQARPLESAPGLSISDGGFDSPPPEPEEVVADLRAQAASDGTVDVVVGLADGVDPATTIATATGVDPATVRVVAGDTAAVELTADQVAALDAAPGVDNVVEDQRLEKLLTQSTERIGATTTYAGNIRGTGTRIAIIDSGVDGTHAAFAGSISTAEEGCFVSFPGADEPCNGVGAGMGAPCSVADCFHGTHVASIAAGDAADSAPRGVAPDTQIIPIRVFSGDAENVQLGGESTASTADLVTALEHVIACDAVEPIDAVNLSLGVAQDLYPLACDALSPQISDRINALRAAGVAVVVATGNSGGSLYVAFPACVEAATAVTATLDDTDQVWFGSDTGPMVSLAAPGSPITAADMGGGATTAQGTSMAAPHVAGAVALLRQSHGDMSVDWIEERLWDTGVRVTDPTNGLQLRRIDVAAATGLRAPVQTPPDDTMWLITNYGEVIPKGWALDASEPQRSPGEVVVAATATRSGMGLWLVTNWGRVIPYGDAPFYGDRAGLPLNQPITAMTVTRSGKGYWLLAADGGIFSYGDAGFYGSTGGIRLNAPVTDMAVTPAGNGYWFTAKDGGVFSYGDATFYGSTGAITINQPVVSMAAGPTAGYWLVAQDGGVFAYSVPFHGSLPGVGVGGTGHRVRDTAGGRGYYITTLQGGSYPFGVATDFGGSGPLRIWETTVDLAMPAD